MSKPIYLMVTQFFPTPESWRGAFCYDFARAVMRMDRYDVRVMVVSRLGGGDYDYNGIHVLRCRDYVWKLNFGRMVFAPLNRRTFENKLAEANIRESDIAIVHFHDVNYVGLAEGLKKRNPAIKVMLHFHNGGHPFTVSTARLGVIPLYSTLLYLFFRRGFELVDIPVFVSERQRQMFGRWYPHGTLGPSVDVLKDVWGGRFIRPVRLAPSYVLHNGIDYSVFNSEDRVKSMGFTIGCVANVDPWKDQMTLLKAVNALRNKITGIRLVIVGTGPMLKACREYVETEGMGQVVEFRQEVDHLDLPRIYRSFDLFVIPSFLEGFCCSYMEAWGCGTPVIGCKGVCLDEAIVPEEQDLWLVDPKDVEGLSARILRFHQCACVQHMIHDYDINRMVESFFSGVGL